MAQSNTLPRSRYFSCPVIELHGLPPPYPISDQGVTDDPCHLLDIDPSFAHWDAGYSKQQSTIPLDAENAFYIKQEPCRIFNRPAYVDRYKEYYNVMPDFSKLHNTKAAGNASEENETQISALAFQVLNFFPNFSMEIFSMEFSATHCSILLLSLHIQGTMKIFEKDGRCINEVTGSGHHGKDYVGVASVRAGKGMAMGSMIETSMTKIV